VRSLPLRELSIDEIAAMVQQRYGSELSPNLARWLWDLSGGNLTFVVLYLRTLEAEGAIRSEGNGYVLDGSISGEPGAWQLAGALAALPTPTTVLDVLRPRLAPLEDDARRLLQSGSVQGPRFLSSVLVDVLEQEEDAVLDALHRIEEEHRLIRFDTSEDWWSERSALCSFDPRLLRELLYERFRTAYEKRREHKAVAEALERLLEGEQHPPRAALLEVAHHYAEANQPVAAARCLLRAAESTHREGAVRDTEALAGRALELLRDVPPAERDDRLFAETVALYVVATDDRWRLPELGEASLLALVAEAEEAAVRVGDPRVESAVRYAKGLLLGAFDRLPASIAELERARDLARGANDAVAEFSIVVDLGHRLDSDNLETGRRVLGEADALLASGALDDLLDERTLALSRARLDSALGVAEFDLGHYGEALRLLPASVDGLREIRVFEEGAWTLSFLAQLHTAIGLFEAAERAVREGLAIFADDHGVIGPRSYLRALLGRLYVEWDPPRLADAGAPLEEGLAEARRGGHLGTVGLVETYYGGYLLTTGDADGADRLLADTIAAADAGGWHRAAVAARSLRALAALALGRTGEAVRLSGEAVERLRAQGGFVPAVRSEEVLFTHGRVLEAAGSAEARPLYEEAAKVVRAKAATLEDDAHKQSFLTRVRLSREILAAADAQLPDA
jgi:tetratricopeptide (TPR) repeat protein